MAAAKNAAQWYPVPEQSIISVEHPCLVKNADRAIDMLGALSLSFRPDDPASRTIISENKPAHNVLIRITMPKRTGRKRKRGSDSPFVIDPAASSIRRDAAYLLRSMRDNQQSTSIEPLGSIPQMHIWRSIPDYVYSTSHSKCIKDVRDKVMSTSYPDLASFELPRTYGIQNTETVPPAVWSTESIPRNYMYRQNPALKIVKDPDTGKRVLTAAVKPPKVFSHQVQWDTAVYPSTTLPNIPPLEEQSTNFQVAVQRMRKLFDERPIWTRRALINAVHTDLISVNAIRFAVAYVAYALRSGPWRDAYVKLGVDPRTDSSYRFYQTIMVQLVPKEHTAIKPTITAENDPEVDEESRRTAENRQAYERRWAMSNNDQSHIFTGIDEIPPDGKVWQLCDIQDPQLRPLVDISDDQVRSECETRYFGWYKNGTNAKLRVALRAKIDALVQKEDVQSVNEELATFLQLMPEEIAERNDPTYYESNAESENATAGYMDPRTASRQQIDWASAYRSFARTGAGRMPGAKPVRDPDQQPVRPPTNADFARLRGDVTAKEPRPRQRRVLPTERRSSRVTSVSHSRSRNSLTAEPSHESRSTLSHLQNDEVLPSIEVDLDDFEDGELDLDIDVKEEPDSDAEMPILE